MSEPDGRQLAHGLLSRTPEGVALQGSRCNTCGTHYFPLSAFCNNPACKGADMQPVALSGSGKIHSFTVQYYPPPPPFNLPEPFSPYAIGLVELPEGIRILGMIDTDDPEGLVVGTQVDLQLLKLAVDANGNDVVTWKFIARA